MWWLATIRHPDGSHRHLQVWARDEAHALQAAVTVGTAVSAVPDHARMRAEFDECVDRR